MEYTEEEKKAIEYVRLMKNKTDFNKLGYVYGTESVDIVLNLLGRYYVYAHNYRDLLKKALDDVRKESKKNADSIPKEAIREKIKELLEKLYKPNNDRWEKDDTIYYDKIKCQIRVLKELLGE